jgi:DHA1 family bicyclomycin/chloramphenicol resistance-like MFS transporter
MKGILQQMKQGPGYREFVTLMAVIISITALSIDIMLQSLPQIGRDLRVGHANDAQLVVTVLLFCMGILFGNPNAMAMEPLKHLAGIGAAMIGSVGNLVSSLFVTPALI